MAAERLPNALAGACSDAEAFDFDGARYTTRPESALESCRGCAVDATRGQVCDAINAASNNVSCYHRRVVFVRIP